MPEHTTPSRITLIVLEAISGSRKGHKLWLRPGQEIVLGRSAEADVDFADDGEMTARHFSVQCQTDACRLRDCESTNGVFVNGQRAAEAILCDGDCITAGHTEFAVTVSGREHRPCPATTRIVPPAPCSTTAEGEASGGGGEGQPHGLMNHSANVPGPPVEHYH